MQREDSPLVYFRYSDDILGVMTGGEDRLHAFFTGANTAHGNLKFTLEKSSSEINFLDRTVYVGEADRLLHTKVLYKPRDLHSYQRVDANHL